MQFYKAWLADDHTVQSLRVVAQNVLQAAEHFIQGVEDKRVDYPVGSGRQHANVIVKSEAGVEYKILVTGEQRPVYSAREVSEFTE